MTPAPAAICPAADQAQARKLRNETAAYLAQLGHEITWTKGHGVGWLNPHAGYRGVCTACGGMARVAWYDGSNYRAYEGAIRKQDGHGPRKCNRGIRTP